MKGDYFRYLAEIATDDERQSNLLNFVQKQIFISIPMVGRVEESRCAYKDGFDMAKNQLTAANPTRLGIALNFSVFLFEILNEVTDACHMAYQVRSIDRLLFLYLCKFLFNRPLTRVYLRSTLSTRIASKVRRGLSFYNPCCWTKFSYLFVDANLILQLLRDNLSVSSSIPRYFSHKS